MVNNQNFLKLDNISKTYEDGYQACKDINFTIPSGKFLTILGPSGCGKTTILKMIAGFEMPSTGKILVNDLDIKDVPIYKRQTATVFQDYALFPNMTVFQNIAYGIKLLREKKDNVPADLQKELQKVRNDALKKANAKLKELEEKKTKINKELIKLGKFYLKNETLLEMQDMRANQFQASYTKLLQSYTKHSKTNEEFKLSGKNRRKIAYAKFLSKLGINKIVNFVPYDPKNKYETDIYKLLRWYIFKMPVDRKIDILKAQFRDYDEWTSYWQNYPNQQVENFEKNYTTRPLNEQEIKQKAQEAIKLVGLEGKENNYPSDLSGGMQQRVALARAIVVKPDILLLDEPLSALDAKVRKKMQEELKRIHNELKINFILVTHDQEEALSLSDIVIVMSKGRIQQIGSPKTIYEHPTNEWVAKFIGQSNFFDGYYLNNELFFDDVKINTENVKFPFSKVSTTSIPYKIMIRPEDFIPCIEQDSMLNVKVVSCIYKGSTYEVHCLTRQKHEMYFVSLVPFKVSDFVFLKWNLSMMNILPIKRQKGIMEM